MAIADPELKPALDRAKLRLLVSQIVSMIEDSAASEVYFIVASPTPHGGCQVVCADTGGGQFGREAVETFHGYIKSKI